VACFGSGLGLCPTFLNVDS